MKDAKFEVEFLTHCLANSEPGTASAADTFQRDGDGKIVMQQSWFHSAFGKAIYLARLEDQVEPGEIQIDPSVKADTQNWVRHYGEGMSRTHEAIMPKTRVVFDCMVADHVTHRMLHAILEKMGKYVGLSPYGFRLGYGKFNVISISISEPADQV